MIPFKDSYRRMYRNDGKPKSYLSYAYQQRQRLAMLQAKQAGNSSPNSRNNVIIKSPRRMSIGSGSEWIELKTAEGKPYYYHKETSKVQWNKPQNDLVRIQANLKNTSPQSPKLTTARRESTKSWQ